MTNNSKMPGKNEQVNELRELIQHAFPAITFAGKITNYDDKLDDPHLDEEKDLYEALKGQKWTTIPGEILDKNPDGYLLLTDQASTAFIAAWFMRSLENPSGENVVRDFVVYSFTPKHDKIPDTTEFVHRRLRVFTPEQRHTVRSLLAEFAEQDPSAFQRRLAAKAVELIDSLS